MATTITGKLNQAAREFQAGTYAGFGIRLGVQYYDRETKSRQWTNYEAAFFSNNTQQIDFMRSVLVEGAIVEVTAKGEKIKSFEGQNGQVLSIDLIDASMGMVHAPQQAPAQPAYGQAPQQPQQMAPQQVPQQQPAYGQQPQNQMGQAMGAQVNPK